MKDRKQIVQQPFPAAVTAIAAEHLSSKLHFFHPLTPILLFLSSVPFQVILFQVGSFNFVVQTTDRQTASQSDLLRREREKKEEEGGRRKR